MLITLCDISFVIICRITSTELIFDPGISNMASKRSFSKIALNPLAPVFLLIAFRAITLNAPSVNVKST